MAGSTSVTDCTQLTDFAGSRLPQEISTPFWNTLEVQEWTSSQFTSEIKLFQYYVICSKDQERFRHYFFEQLYYSITEPNFQLLRPLSA